MMNKLKTLIKYLFLGSIGGTVYVCLELIWRGYSHWTMFLLGGICFICLGLINEILNWSTPLWEQMIIGGTIITVLEFITGCIVNLWLGWDIWNYTWKPNLWGQISLYSSIGWVVLSVVGIILDDYIRYWFFGEDKPRYKLL